MASFFYYESFFMFDFCDREIFFIFYKILVAALTNLILILPSILLVSLFEESRRRISKVTRLRTAIKKLKGSLYNEKIKMFYQRNSFIYEGFCFIWYIIHI